MVFVCRFKPGLRIDSRSKSVECPAAPGKCMDCAFTAQSAKKVSTLNLTEPARQLQQIMFILFQFGKRKFLSLRFLLDLLQELLATFTKFCVFLFALGLKACDNTNVKGGIESISFQNEAAASLAF